MLLRVDRQDDRHQDQQDQQDQQGQPPRDRQHRRALRAWPAAGALGVLLTAALLPGSAGLAAASVLPPGGLPPSVHSAGSGPAVVSAVPSTATPQVENGEVDAITAVGSLIVLGGTFSAIQPPGGGTEVTQTGIVAFDAATGAIDTAFAPALNGPVKALIPGPVAGTVYVGGTFTSVNGATSKLALLDLATGHTHAGFTPPTMNGQVNALALSGGRLFVVGGGFTKINNATHDGLAVLAPTTGAVSTYLNVQLTGHHGAAGAVPTPVGTRSLAVSPDGTKLVVIGNFTSAADPSGTVARNQAVRILLGSSSGLVDRNWATAAFSAQCSNFDSYVNDVEYSPDGSYFVVVSTGGPGQLNSDGSRSLCDAASGWSGSATGTAVKPTWVDYTGQDTLLSVAISSSAIYVGGHQRWLNNSTGTDSAGEGAVPRPSLAALDPANGLPLSWNPGRDPRGNGVSALLVTGTGLYEGSDTNFLGNNAYLRPRVGFFPLTGGVSPASTALSALPGDLYTASPAAAATTRTGQHLSSAGVPDGSPLTDSSLDWSQTRGAFVVGGTLFYGKAGGGFFSRPITQSTLGSETAIDPYNDPAWSSVQTGSGQTYDGVLSSFYGEIPSLTSAFYSGGRIYYTLTGHTQMFSRAFTPDSGIVGADETTVLDGFNWTKITGATVIGSKFYYSNSVDQELHALTWSTNHASGVSAVVSASPTWSGSSLFAVTDPTAATSPLPPGGGGGTNPGGSPLPPTRSTVVPLSAKAVQAKVARPAVVLAPASLVIFRFR